jgi:hypothetical protein
MENRNIANAQITASSFWDPNNINTHGPQLGRLNQGGTCWCARHNRNQWLQVDLGSQVSVTGVASQGRQNTNQWVKRYWITYSGDKQAWNYYKDGASGNQPYRIFTANRDRNTVVTHQFTQPFRAQYVRFNMGSGGSWYRSHMSMRVEVYGCRDAYSIDGGGWELVRRVTRPEVASG